MPIDQDGTYLAKKVQNRSFLMCPPLLPFPCSTSSVPEGVAQLYELLQLLHLEQDQLLLLHLLRCAPAPAPAPATSTAPLWLTRRCLPACF